ncbi:MAG: Holliday junction resolvase RuvX [Christensenellales bacterium]
MGIDFGKVRIGIALTDPLGIIASPFETYQRVSFSDDINYLAKLIKLQNVDTVIFGLPLQMDGQEGDMAKATREFAGELEKVASVKIVFEDERLSSVTAEEILIEAGVKREKRKLLIDKIAAQVILQQYIERRR